MNTPHPFKLLSVVRPILAVALFAGALSVQAEPYMAVRTGFKCSQCHLNQTGGGGRTEFGQAYTEYKLLMKQTQEAILSGREGLTSFDPRLNDAVTIGANFRMEQFAQTKYSDSSGSVPSTREALASEANVYINVEVVKNFLSLYIDQNMARSSNREMWMMARNLPFNSYVKVGNTLVPYGLRLIEPGTNASNYPFIRAKTGYTYGRSELSTEVGVEPGPVSLVANFNNTQFSGIGSVVFRNFRVGGSYGTITDGSKFDTYGPFAGISFGRWTMLSEVDFITKANTADSLPDLKQVAQFYEVNFLPHQGLNLKTSFEYFDRNTSVANKKDGQQRWTFGAEYFPLQHVQLAVYYQLNKSLPQALAENQDVIIGRAHVFF